MPDNQSSESASEIEPARVTAPAYRWEFQLTAILLGLTVCLVYSDSIFFNKVYYWGDIGLFFLPLSQFLKTNMAQGRIPLWNPLLFCGAPFVGNPQVSIVYPSTLFLPFFPAAKAIMLAEAAHIFAAGMFFWYFVRRGSLRLDYIPSLLSSVVYMLCGYFIAKAQFPNMLAALTYVPLLLYATEAAVKNPSFRASVLFGLALGMQLLAAHTQITVFTLYLMIAYGLWIFVTFSERALFWRTLVYAIIGGLVAAGLACVYWLPTAQLIHFSARQTLSLHVANRFYLPWYELADIVLPHLHGSPMRGNWSAHGNYWETDNFIGIVPLALALFGLSAGLRADRRSDLRKQTLFWLTTAIISTWLSLGSFGGLYRAAFYVLPALRLFHDPARLMLGTTVTLALYAGLGLQSLIRLTPSRYSNVVAYTTIVLSVSGLAIHAHEIYPEKPIQAIEEMADDDVPTLMKSDIDSAGAGRIMMPDSQRAWQSFTTYRSYEQNDPTFMSEWPDTLSPCLGMTYGLREVGGYDPEVRRDSQILVSTAQNLIVPPVNKHVKFLGTPPTNFAHYLSLLGVQYLVTYRTGSLTANDLVPIYQPDWTRRHRKVTVYRNAAYHGRASLYTSWVRVDNQRQAMQMIDQALRPETNKNMLQAPFIESRDTACPAVAARRSGVQFAADNPDYVDLKTQASSLPAVLVLDDTMHPGWTATLDGHATDILRANVDQRAVYIPSSGSPVQHDITFVYKPAVFLAGLYVTLVTLLIIIAVVISGRVSLARSSQ